MILDSCSAVTGTKSTQISLYYSAAGATLVATTPSETLSDAVVSIYWYPNSQLGTFSNACPSTTIDQATYQPSFQYTIYLGYCQVFSRGSYKYQVGSYSSGTGNLYFSQ